MACAKGSGTFCLYRKSNCTKNIAVGYLNFIDFNYHCNNLVFAVSYLFFVCIFYYGFKDELSEIFDKTYLAVMLAGLGIITFCRDLFKAKTEINLVLTYFIFLAFFSVLKIVIPIIIKKIHK